jgi:hypothetical protein
MSYRRNDARPPPLCVIYRTELGAFESVATHKVQIPPWITIHFQNAQSSSASHASNGATTRPSLRIPIDLLRAHTLLALILHLLSVTPARFLNPMAEEGNTKSLKLVQRRECAICCSLHSRQLDTCLSCFFQCHSIPCLSPPQSLCFLLTRSPKRVPPHPLQSLQEHLLADGSSRSC